MSSKRIPVSITVQPWFKDHCFAGKVVLPAVETMLLLAGVVHRSFPAINTRRMEHASFRKFIEISNGQKTIDAETEWFDHKGGILVIRLLSRKQLKSMTRLQEHAEIRFSPAPVPEHPAPIALQPSPEDCTTSIPAERVYRELVPFGPAYRSLTGLLTLNKKEVWGTLQAPTFSTESIQNIIGSPFPLDGALHAACVLGQRCADFVPFPVGFTRRLIHRPTQTGKTYFTRSLLVTQSADELLFDLQIFDSRGEIFETVNGVRMRDVSGGRIKPPAWIKCC